MRGTGRVARIRDMQNAYKILVGKPEGKRPHGRLVCIWEDNIKIDLKERMWEGVDWIHLAQNRDWWQQECAVSFV
jgi:hypothetical protein